MKWVSKTDLSGIYRGFMNIFYQKSILDRFYLLRE